MKIILEQDVPNLGKKGDLKDVAPGYARNHLIPRGLAVEATPQRMKEWERNAEAREAQNKKQEEQARQQAENLGQHELVFKMPAGEGGRLFGSVTPADIAGRLAEAGLEIDKKKIELTEQIKSLGQFKADVRLYPGIKAEVSIIVEQED